MNPTDLAGRAGATPLLGTPPTQGSGGARLLHGARPPAPTKIEQQLLSGHCLVREDGRMLLKAPEPGPRPQCPCNLGLITLSPTASKDRGRDSWAGTAPWVWVGLSTSQVPGW